MATMTAQQFINYVKKPEIAEKFATEVLALLKPKKETKEKAKVEEKGGEK